MTIDRTARHDDARGEEAWAAQARLRRGARWISSCGGDAGNEHSRLRPEDVARSELFYSSTCCWV